MELSKENLQLLHILDIAQRSDDLLGGLYAGMDWCTNPWLRENLVSLSEHSFERTGPDVVTSLKGRLYGFDSSVSNEEGFNKLESAGRHSRCRRLAVLADTGFSRALTASVDPRVATSPFLLSSRSLPTRSDEPGWHKRDVCLLLVVAAARCTCPEERGPPTLSGMFRTWCGGIVLCLSSPCR